MIGKKTTKPQPHPTEKKVKQHIFSKPVIFMNLPFTFLPRSSILNQSQASLPSTKIEEVYQNHSKSKLLELRQSRIKCRGPCEDINIVHIAKDYLLYKKVYTNVICWYTDRKTLWPYFYWKKGRPRSKTITKLMKKLIWQINILIPPTKQNNWFVTILCYEQWCEQIAVWNCYLSNLNTSGFG